MQRVFVAWRLCRLQCTGVLFFLLVKQHIFVSFCVSMLVIGMTAAGRGITSKLASAGAATWIRSAAWAAPCMQRSAASFGSSSGRSALLPFTAWPSLFCCTKTKLRSFLKPYILGYLTTSAPEKKRNQYVVRAVVLPILNVQPFSKKHAPLNFPFHFLNYVLTIIFCFKKAVPVCHEYPYGSGALPVGYNFSPTCSLWGKRCWLKGFPSPDTEMLWSPKTMTFIAFPLHCRFL